MPGFNASPSGTTFKVGDTVRFAFSGKADNIAFYSGEPGFSYKYKDRTSADGIPQLEFSSYLQNKGETNTLRLLISTDFNGAYDSVGIRRATWTDYGSGSVIHRGG